MGWRNEQCRKICRIIDNFLANRPTERDSLIVAVQKAFEALEQAETNCSEIPNNSDTISRQQAIDAFETAAKGGASIEDIILILENLPSVQPDIIRCKDCKSRDNDDFCTGRGFPYQLVPDDGFCDKGERKE